MPRIGGFVMLSVKSVVDGLTKTKTNKTFLFKNYLCIPTATIWNITGVKIKTYFGFMKPGATIKFTDEQLAEKGAKILAIFFKSVGSVVSLAIAEAVIRNILKGDKDDESENDPIPPSNDPSPPSNDPSPPGNDSHPPGNDPHPPGKRENAPCEAPVHCHPCEAPVHCHPCHATVHVHPEISTPLPQEAKPNKLEQAPTSPENLKLQEPSPTLLALPAPTPAPSASLG